MNRIARASIHATCALAAWTSLAGAALAQPAASAPNAPNAPNAPIIKPPPAAASGATSAANPDNMPVKKPRQPTNDKMMHDPPASASNAK